MTSPHIDFEPSPSLVPARLRKVTGLIRSASAAVGPTFTTVVAPDARRLPSVGNRPLALPIGCAWPSVATSVKTAAANRANIGIMVIYLSWLRHAILLVRSVA